MTDEQTLRERHASLFELEKARERDQRPCVWSEGEVPRHVAEYLWDASYDRRRLIALVDEARAERDAWRTQWGNDVDTVARQRDEARAELAALEDRS